MLCVLCYAICARVATSAIVFVLKLSLFLCCVLCVLCYAVCTLLLSVYYAVCARMPVVTGAYSQDFTKLGGNVYNA